MGFGCANATPSVARRKARIIHFSSAWRCASVEERVDIGLRIEGDKVVDLLAGPDEANGQIQFAGDCDDDAAFRGTVELGENDAGDSGVAPELARLVQAVLAGGGVEDEQYVMRSARHNLRGGALHFFELSHQVRFCVKASGGIDDDHI